MSKLHKEGYSLIELVFVVTVLAIIAGIAMMSYSTIMRNMQIKADRASASYITKALRSWYEDNMSDISRKVAFNSFIGENLISKTIKLSSLKDEGVEVFLDSNYYPNSLLDDNHKKVEGQAFYVGLVEIDTKLKFVITIETEDKRIGTIDGSVRAEYDGTDIGVVYIES